MKNDELRARLAGKLLCPYLRCSSVAGEESRQRKVIKDWANKLSIMLETEFVEKAKYTSKRHKWKERVAWKNVITFADEHPNQVVVVAEDSSRLWAGRRAVNGMLDDAQEHKFEILSLKTNATNSNPIFFTDTENEKEALGSACDNSIAQIETSSRLIHKKTEVLEQGRYGGGKINYINDIAWYKCRMDGEALETDEYNMLIKEKIVARLQKINHGNYTAIWYDENGEVIKTQTDLRYQPHRDERDGVVAFLEPTTLPERLEVARLIFNWIDKEYIRASEVARRLITMGFSSAGVGWSGERVKDLVDDEKGGGAMIGLPIIGKVAIEPRQYIDPNGEIKPFPVDKCKTLGFNMRKEFKSHQRRPQKPIYEPIINPELYWRVQTKIKSNWTKRNNPPKRHFNVLKGLIYHNKLPMILGQSRGQQGKNDYYFYISKKYNDAQVYLAQQGLSCAASVSLLGLMDMISTYFQRAEERLEQLPEPNREIFVPEDYKKLFLKCYKSTNEIYHQIVSSSLWNDYQKPTFLFDECRKTKKSPKLVVISLKQLYEELKMELNKQLDTDIEQFNNDWRQAKKVYDIYVNDGVGEFARKEQAKQLKSIEDKIKELNEAKQVNSLQQVEDVWRTIGLLKAAIKEYQGNYTASDGYSKLRSYIEAVISRIDVQDDGEKSSGLTIMPASELLGEPMTFTKKDMRAAVSNVSRRGRNKFLQNQGKLSVLIS